MSTGEAAPTHSLILKLQRSDRLLVVALALVIAVSAFLGFRYGWVSLTQVTVNGVVSGTYIALGAAGLTLVFAVLRLINFAYGDYLTLGAYLAILCQAVLSDSLVVVLIFATVALTLFAVALEFALWRPIRNRGAGFFQLVICALGLAYIMRYTIQVTLGAGERQLNVDVINSFHAGDIRIGRTQFFVTVIGLTAIAAFAVALKRTGIGKQIRAVADNRALAETTGINSSRIIVWVWALSGAFAGLAGVLYAAPIGYVNPNLGFAVMLSMFAALILGGIGSVYGALLGGLIVGVAQEWSTLVISPQLKVAVGFGILIVTLLVRPRGLFGRPMAIEGAA